MKKRLDTYCSLLIFICAILLVFNVTDRITECYNLGKGAYSEVSSSGWWVTKMCFWAIDMNVLLISLIVFILIIKNIHKTIVFDWKNVRLFRGLSFTLFLHFIFSTGVNYIDYYILETTKNNPFEVYTGNVADYSALIATLFILIIGEVFAVGLRLQEEQELTI